ncbi:MAG: surfactin synthase thioesterase subunit [Arenicella sp.]|jgi:surfactin synthase thioesterase subunit
MSDSNLTYLFAVPYAGGSATATYTRWGAFLSDDIKVTPLELAGHGRIMKEAFLPNIMDDVEDLFNSIKPIALTSAYMIMGHSMGTIIIYELLKRIMAEGLPEPKGVFLSGRNPPNLPYHGEILHVLNDDQFLNRIKKIGGTPDSFFEFKDLVKTFLPILRSDYRKNELYQFQRPSDYFATKFVFFFSDNDPHVTKPEIFEWRKTADELQVHDFSGDHFFINDEVEAICNVVNSIAKTNYLCA